LTGSDSHLLALGREALLLVVILPVMAGVIALITRKALPMFRRLQDKLDRINRVMRETLAGIRVIRAFDRTEHEERRFAEANDDLTATTLRVTRLFALMMPTIFLIVNLSTVAVMWFGSKQVADARMSVGDLTAFGLVEPVASHLPRSSRNLCTSLACLVIVWRASVLIFSNLNGLPLAAAIIASGLASSTFLRWASGILATRASISR
jgi:ABC-type bacteriocin/lantibiotic exporter with double-glycine peptidase domain